MNKYKLMITLAVASLLAFQVAEAPIKPITTIQSVEMVESTSSSTLSVVGRKITANNVLAGINNERIKIGLAPLVVNDKLVSAAKTKAHDVYTRKYWSHDTPEGKKFYTFISESGYIYSHAGENLAKDFQNTPQVIKGWMDSPTHKANIVKPEYTETGIAVEGNIIVQMFGTR